MATSMGKMLHSITTKLSFLNICFLCLCCIMYLVCTFTGQWLVFSKFEHNQTVIKYDLHYFYPKSNLSDSDLISVKKEWQLSLTVAKLVVTFQFEKFELSGELVYGEKLAELPDEIICKVQNFWKYARGFIYQETRF